jgi:hypothetical protein
MRGIISMQKFIVRDVVLLSGWLFADLLLGLMVIFLVSIPGIPTLPPRVIPPPTLQVSPTKLNPGNCSGRDNSYQCKVTLSETSDSLGHIQWKASSDMSNKTVFAPQVGTLSPKKSVTITISAIPCQTGSFTFSGHVPDNEKIPGDIFGSYNVQPVTVSWSCQLDAIKLNLTHTSYTWHVSDVQKLLQGDAGTADEIRKQAKDSIPANLHVGFIIVYGGAGSDSDSDIQTADQVSLRVYDILVAYGRNGGFVPLRDAVAYHVKLHTQQPGLNALGFIRVDIFSYNR